MQDSICSHNHLIDKLPSAAFSGSQRDFEEVIQRSNCQYLEYLNIYSSDTVHALINLCKLAGSFLGVASLGTYTLSDD